MGFKKTLLLTACVVMILGTAISGTLAYYQMSLVESAADAAADVDKNVNVIRVFHDEHGNQVDQMLPGMTVWQDVEIRNNSGVEMYVFYTYEIPCELVDNVKDENKVYNEAAMQVTNGLNSDWTVKNRELSEDGQSWVYTCLYKNTVSAGSGITVYNAQSFYVNPAVGYNAESGNYYIKIDADTTVDLQIDLTFDMKVTAYGVSTTRVENVSGEKIVTSAETAYDFYWKNLSENEGTTSSIAE